MEENRSMVEVKRVLQAELDAAMEFFLERMAIARRVPRDARLELTEILKLPAAKRPSIGKLWEERRLKERFGVGRNAWYEYANRVHSMQVKAACGEVLQALAGLMTMPGDYYEELHDKSETLLLGRMAQMLQERTPEPAELARLSIALAMQRTARTRAAHQKQAAQRHRLTMQAARKKTRPETQRELNERVRRIYGIEMPKCRPTSPSSSPSGGETGG